MTRVRDVSNWQSGLQLFRGQFQTYGHPKYGLIVTKWPRKRGPAKTPLAALNMAMFKQVIAWAKFPLSSEITEAQIGTFQTGYLIRDVIESAAYGLVTYGYDDAGNLYMGFRLANQQIQVLLDSIGLDPGSMLFRGPDGWLALEAGDAGTVLSSPGTGQPPLWIPTSGLVSPPALQLNVPATATSAQNFATEGIILRPVVSLKMQALQVIFSSVTGGTYRLGVAAFNTATNKIVGAPTWGTPFTVAAGNGQDIRISNLAFNLDLAVSTAWIIMLNRQNGTATTPMTLWFSSTAVSSWALVQGTSVGASSLGSATLNPTSGSTWATVGSGIWAFSMLYAPL